MNRSLIRSISSAALASGIVAGTAVISAPAAHAATCTHYVGMNYSAAFAYCAAGPGITEYRAVAYCIAISGYKWVAFSPWTREGQGGVWAWCSPDRAYDSGVQYR
ncbi:hypothetical protein EV652_101900 [Kribbella steppae]|uniref:Uncharacterized protein n=1 Tax=Kribbella steppae TaxID=2512223 RepID=A0A4R2HWS4_9ACTN|nr:hypothetical protein [Kribbella steppae]TCO36011.1 hypothetical protein EV652_101900 [Kribbella steppae]